MSWAIFSNNIRSNRIVGYLIGPGVLALVAFFLDLPVEVKVGSFAVLVIAWSLAFPIPSQGGGLPAKAVDFWYYGLGILGVLLFFLSGGIERERVLLREQFQTERARASEAQARYDLLQIVPKQADQILDQVRKVADARIGNPDLARAQCESALIEDRLRRIERVDRFPAHRGRDVPELNDPLAVCSYVIEQNDWIAIANASNVAEMLAAVDRATGRQKFFTDIPVILGSTVMKLTDIREYLVLVPNSEKWEGEIARRRAEHDQATEKAFAASERYRTIGGDIDGPLSIAAAERAARFAWPFILITALGMKIARQPYAYLKLE